jgi:hypothetical protein
VCIRRQLGPCSVLAHQRRLSRVKENKTRGFETLVSSSSSRRHQTPSRARHPSAGHATIRERGLQPWIRPPAASRRRAGPPAAGSRRALGCHRGRQPRIRPPDASRGRAGLPAASRERTATSRGRTDASRGGCTDASRGRALHGRQPRVRPPTSSRPGRRRLAVSPSTPHKHEQSPLFSPSSSVFLGQRILPLLIREEETRCTGAVRVWGFDFDGVEVRPQSDLCTSAAFNQGRGWHRDHGWWWWYDLVVVEEGWTPSSCCSGWRTTETWRCRCWWSPTRCSRFHVRCR